MGHSPKQNNGNEKEYIYAGCRRMRMLHVPQTYGSSLMAAEIALAPSALIRLPAILNFINALLTGVGY